MQKPIHVLQVFPSFCPGGAQMRFTRLANAFGAEFRYTVLAMDGNFEAAKLLAPKVSVKLISPEVRGLPGSAIGIRKLITQIRPDLTVTSNWGSMDALLASWSVGVCPTIHTEDGFGPDEASRLKFRRVVTRRILLNKIHKTIVPSKTLLRIARERYGLGDSKVTFVPNGIDVLRFQPSQSREVRRTLGAKDETVVIGFIGHLRPEKTLDVLIKAFAAGELRNALLVLVGDGPCRKDLELLATQLGVSDRIRFVGHVTDPHPYLAAFDVFAMSSATEQMPLSILEAMAYGLPVVSTDVGDCADMLNICEAPAIVPRGDIRAYAESLKALVTQSDLRRCLGARNRQRCATTYSFGQMAEAYEEIYRTAAAGLTESPGDGSRLLERQRLSS